MAARYAATKSIAKWKFWSNTSEENFEPYKNTPNSMIYGKLRIYENIRKTCSIYGPRCWRLANHSIKRIFILSFMLALFLVVFPIDDSLSKVLLSKAVYLGHLVPYEKLMLLVRKTVKMILLDIAIHWSLSIKHNTSSRGYIFFKHSLGKESIT